MNWQNLKQLLEAPQKVQEKSKEVQELKKFLESDEVREYLKREGQKVRALSGKVNPQINIVWIRFPYDKSADLNWALTKPYCLGSMGGKGAGKSALCEALASKYPKIIDLYGSRDNEGLSWLRSPFKDDVLFMKGHSTEVDCNCAHVMNTSEVTIKDLKNYSAIVSVASFYADAHEEWGNLARFMKKLWHRKSWKEPWCVLIREASNLIYSRLSMGENQMQAKAHLIYVLREMRHCGFAVAFDTIRWHSIDVDFRSIADYLFVKAQGIEGLPRGLKFLYRYFDPYGVMRMPVRAFMVVSRKGPLGFGVSTEPYWHKQEYENMLGLFDIRTKYGEIPFESSISSGKVTDYQHVRIVKVRIEQKTSMGKIADQEGRSSKTVHHQITAHNYMIKTAGICDRCERVHSKYAKQIIEHGKKKGGS